MGFRRLLFTADFIVGVEVADHENGGHVEAVVQIDYEPAQHPFRLDVLVARVPRFLPASGRNAEWEARLPLPQFDVTGAEFAQY